MTYNESTDVCTLSSVPRLDNFIERFTKEIAPLILTGPPAVTGFAGGRPKVEEIVAYWPALIPKEEITPSVEVLDA